MLEESFMAADVHSVVGVQEQARETSCKVTHKIIWDGAQGLLHFGRQLPVMVLLWRKTEQEKLSQRVCSGASCKQSCWCSWTQ